MRATARSVPVLVWLAAIAGVYHLAGRRPISLDYPGQATVRTFTASAAAEGKLELLTVARHSVVEAGDILGRVDGAALELRARQVRHRIAELRAEMVRERELQDVEAARVQDEQDLELRRYQRDVENARLGALEVLSRLEESRIRLQGVRVDLDRQKDLADMGLFSEAELIRTRIDHDALGKRIQENEAFLASHRSRIGAVEARLADYREVRKVAAADIEKVVGAYHWRIAAEQEELELIALQRQRLVIRAPGAGFVTEVLASAGDYLVAGRPIASIVETVTRDAVGYVPAAEIGTVRPGMDAEFERSTAPGRLIATKVVSVGPALAELPVELRRIPTVPEWGIPVNLELTPEMGPIPGEVLRIRLRR